MKDVKRVEELLKNLNYMSEKEQENVKNAYDFVCEKSKDTSKDELDEYIVHPLNVAYILSTLELDETTIISSLLHGLIKQGVSEEEIEKNFGTDVLTIVKNVTTISRLELTNNNEREAIYLRKVLVGLSIDVRVLYVKLADRLHNMRSIWIKNPEEHLNKVEETMKVLIPIAHRLGIYGLKSDLEDLCLKYTKPDIYSDITDKLNQSIKELEDVLKEMQEDIENILIKNGIKFHIKSRVKSIYSIYKKLSSGKKWSDIYDILALRIITQKKNDCYLIIGLIHEKYRPIPKRFKDYIAMPKENMYQSLHTGVIGTKGNIFEIQVRTFEMDELAEKGIASHWTYKEKGTKKIQNIMEQKLELFRNIIETYNEEKEEDFDFSTQETILNDMIYCFTPKGDCIELPRGATPVDFAYRIHSKIGDTIVGAIVNDEIVPLSYELQDNDIVKINTNKNSNPSMEWLKFVKTNSAKSKIKSYFSKKDQDYYIQNGKVILEKNLKTKHLSLSDVEKNSKIILKELKLNNLEELYLNIGSLRYTASYIIRLFFEEESPNDDLLTKFSKKRTNPEKSKNDIIIDGYDDILVTKALCCKPVKGDSIIGFITKGSGITVHKKTCPNIKDKERLINVSWRYDTDTLYESDLEIISTTNKNLIADIINKATTKNITVSYIKTKGKDSLIYDLTVLVKDKDELTSFASSLKDIKYFKEVSIK